ncbi:sulfate ABC transporter substrate-binding protein [Nocardia otitidiscaviarum]|uniref:Sulfate ABC transporter substrate-binding protein n=1 Tax=Nocardia otitidiscaviarum TaxID=1823 RepID=A0A516NQ88_9NOCA|nr:sulfate ABC transporter substrate-binding protein [Nocardia otitidiscaviarum]MBF6182815.1 sulfate ABC transporter substrate-binding protein [Nocardia otitidiscaviarum]MCP9620167.1 sulfate ABC transporter substrate-binding protein [Nocardia otitidiscaviarum]QDP81053.1 sulfate ABC transporter substrate-binding protein [Nocardia otitidiscaviarum]
MPRSSRLRRPALVTALVAALALTGCSGGSSDEIGGGDTDNSRGTLHLYAYAVPKPGFDKVVPAFNETEAGEGVEVVPSYGASGDQSRKVAKGADADVVNFSVEPDITRLVDAGLVDPDWNADANKGIPFGSVVTLVVREGNPKNIRDWDDLLRPGVEVVTPNPFSSGSAKWNLLAPYAAKSEGGKNPQAGLDYLSELLSPEHVKVQPSSGRMATDTFLQGVGDVLISYENEAIFSERQGDPIEHVVPPITFKIENPVAVLKSSRHPERAAAFRDFLYTPAAQRAWAEAGFRPVDPQVRADFAAEFQQPRTLWTIADLGGWQTVDQELFTQGSGGIAVIYERTTG